MDFLYDIVAYSRRKLMQAMQGYRWEATATKHPKKDSQNIEDSPILYRYLFLASELCESRYLVLIVILIGSLAL